MINLITLQKCMLAILESVPIILFRRFELALYEYSFFLTAIFSIVRINKEIYLHFVKSDECQFKLYKYKCSSNE